MAQLQKMEIQVEVKSSGAKYFQIFRSQLYLLPKICPEIVKDIKVVQGDWETVGSIKQWSYVAGDLEVSKEVVEAIDDENKTITFKSFGEAIDKYYKTLKYKVKVNEGLANWTLEYETQSSDVPAPLKYKVLVPVITKAIDDYLSKK